MMRGVGPSDRAEWSDAILAERWIEELTRADLFRYANPERLAEVLEATRSGDIGCIDELARFVRADA